jgi:hypothetical protein
MAKFNVVIDTNIYRSDPSRSDLVFRALERLCQADILKLHLPQIVERESFRLNNSPYIRKIWMQHYYQLMQ